MGGGDLILTTGKDYFIDKEILLYSRINILGHNASMSIAATTNDVSPNRFFAVFIRFHIDKRSMIAPSTEFARGNIRLSNHHFIHLQVFQTLKKLALNL